MGKKDIANLDGISETLLITLYVRARESKRLDAMIKDEKAVEMVNQIDRDFSRLRLQRHDEVAIIMRMRKFDDHVRDFLVQHPDAIVVHIGCGLDTRFERVANDLDVPNVIELRKKFIPNASSHYHTLAASVFDDDWIESVSQFTPRPCMFVAEDVLPYFEETQVKALFLNLRDNFPGCELVCDAHTLFVNWVDNLHLIFTGVEARLQWSIEKGSAPESWMEGIRLLDEWNYYEDDEPRLKAFRWVRLFPAIAKSSGIFHYKLGFAP